MKKFIESITVIGSAIIGILWILYLLVFMIGIFGWSLHWTKYLLTLI